MKNIKVPASVAKTMASKRFIDCLTFLFAVVFVLAIVGIFAGIPQSVMVVVTGFWFVLMALLIMSSIFWAGSHLNPG